MIFDVWISEYNIAIEYQGEHHYRDTEFINGEEGAQLQYEKDMEKSEACKDAGDFSWKMFDL
jgi:hypothetical protein